MLALEVKAAMCDRALVMTSEGFKDAGTRGELRALLGVEPIYDDAAWPDRSDDDCLCSCDVPATAALAGHAVKRDDWGDWELVPAGAGEDGG